MLAVDLTPEGRDDPIFDQMGDRQQALQWHSVQVAQPPDDAVVLASSPECRVQAMRVGPRAWSMQYHVEVEDDTVRNWGAIDAYRDALESTLGPGSLDVLAADAEQLYRNFMTAAFAWLLDAVLSEPAAFVPMPGEPGRVTTGQDSSR